MNEKLRSYIESLFTDAPNTTKAVELKEEIIQNLIDKYNDLVSEGKSEEAAYNIAVSGVGDVSELISQLNSDVLKKAGQIDDRQRTRSAILISVAVVMYILSIIPPIIFNDAVIGTVFMFVMIAVATGLIIFNSMTKKKEIKADDTIVEEFKEWKYENNARNQTYKAITSVLWSLTLVAYFLVSFLTSAWHLTWLIFPISGSVNAVIKAIFDLIKTK